MHDLALQVGEVDVVGVAERDAADAGGREIERGGAAEAARADDERVRREQPLLSFDADLRQQDVAAVAKQLLVVQFVGVGRRRAVSSRRPCGGCASPARP